MTTAEIDLERWLADQTAGWTPERKAVLRDTLRKRANQRRLARDTANQSPDADVFALIGYTPSVPQARFHAATEDDVFYGGAAYGGKSFALVADMILKAHRHPGIRLGCFRNTFDELQESIYPALERFDYARAVGAVWRGSARELHFPNRSVIRLRYLEGPKAITRRQGGSYQAIYIDERTLVDPRKVDILRTERIRSWAGGPPVIGLRSTGNPGGPGHGSVKTRIILPTDYGRITTVLPDQSSVRFIPAKATDNPAPDPTYLIRLDAIPDPMRRAAMRDGSWDVFEGQMFGQWRQDLHVVPPFQIPAEWVRYAGIDYGFANPWAVAWMAEDADGRGWVYRGIHETRVTQRLQARRILSAEADAAEKVRTRWADSAMWAVTGEAASDAELYMQEGCEIEPVSKGPGSRVMRVTGLHRWLGTIDPVTGDWDNLAPACGYHRGRGLTECPRLHVLNVASTANLRETIPNLVRDEKNPEDVDTTGDDHSYDALTYLIHMLEGAGPFEAEVWSPTSGTVPTGPAATLAATLARGSLPGIPRR